jgi:CBS domain-containing protein
LHGFAIEGGAMSDCIRTLLDEKGRDVVIVEPETTVSVAVQRMNQHRIGSVLVGDTYRPGQTYRPVGIFTERDVLARVVARGLDPVTTPVGEVMTRDPVTVHAELTIVEAMRVVTEKRCRHLPVVDDDGLCGLISIGDLMKWIVHDHERTIADLQDFIQRA